MRLTLRWIRRSPVAPQAWRRLGACLAHHAGSACRVVTPPLPTSHTALSDRPLTRTLTRTPHTTSNRADELAYRPTMSQQEEYPEDLNTLKTHQRHVGLGRTMWSVFTYYTVAGDPLDPEHMVSTATSSQHSVVRTRGYRHCPQRTPILSSTEGVRDSRRRIARTHQHTNPSRAHTHTHTHTPCAHTH